MYVTHKVHIKHSAFTSRLCTVNINGFNTVLAHIKSYNDCTHSTINGPSVDTTEQVSMQQQKPTLSQKRSTSRQVTYSGKKKTRSTVDKGSDHYCATVKCPTYVHVVHTCLATQ